MISAVSSYMDPSLMTTTQTQTQKVNPFDKADTNGDGFLDASELASVAGNISSMTGKTMEADQLLADLDSDGDSKLSEEEFEAGRPDGPPPGMMGIMGSGMEGGVKSLLDILNESDDEDSRSTDSMDLNGDGVVDAEEALLGIQNLIHKYLDEIVDTTGQNDENQSQLNLSV